MIVFGSAITRPDVYRSCAEPGLIRAAEADSEILARPAVGSIFQSYNALIEEAGTLPGLEALVLVHQDTEIVDADFGARVRAVLADPEVGLVGCVGSVGVRSIAWWEGSVSAASFEHRYSDHGGGSLPAFSWAWDQAPPYARTGEVDTLDGFLLVLSPWVVESLRFDESLGQLHGYDLDFCLQVRHARRKVVTAPFRAVHHHVLRPFDDPEPWIQAHMAVAEKWDGVMSGIAAGVGSWEQRTRRAQAGRDAAWLLDHGNEMLFEAQTRELERQLAEMRHSLSWRLTAPLRWAARAASPARQGRT